MAKLLSCTYIPIEVHIIKNIDRNIEDYESKGENVKKLSKDLYAMKKTPKLELIFRNDERDFVFNMYNDVCHYTGKKTISEEDAYDFVSKIISGEISISISSDGNYTIS